ANVAVVDLLVIVVLDLHDLVAGGEGPAEPLYLLFAGGVERGLQLNVQRPCARAAAVHRTQHLNVTDGIKPKPFGDPRFYAFDDPADGGLGVLCLHKIEVAFGFWPTEIGYRALVDAMGSGDDAALGGLPEHFSQTHYRYSAG